MLHARRRRIRRPASRIAARAGNFELNGMPFLFSTIQRRESPRAGAAREPDVGLAMMR